MQAASGAAIESHDTRRDPLSPRAMGQTARVSPRLLARLAGAFYVLESATSVFGQFVVTGRLVVSGNAAATAVNLLAHQPLYWLGFTSALLAKEG